MPLPTSIAAPSALISRSRPLVIRRFRKNSIIGIIVKFHSLLRQSEYHLEPVEDLGESPAQVCAMSKSPARTNQTRIGRVPYGANPGAHDDYCANLRLVSGARPTTHSLHHLPSQSSCIQAAVCGKTN